LTLNFNNRKKYYKDKLSKFKTFLKDKLSLILDGHYTSLGVLYGLVVSLLATFYFDGFTLVWGLVIGITIGGFMDYETKKQGRVLKMKAS